MKSTQALFYLWEKVYDGFVNILLLYIVHALSFNVAGLAVVLFVSLFRHLKGHIGEISPIVVVLPSIMVWCMLTTGESVPIDLPLLTTVSVIMYILLFAHDSLLILISGWISSAIYLLDWNAPIQVFPIPTFLGLFLGSICSVFSNVLAVMYFTHNKQSQ